MADKIYSAEQIKVPEQLPGILKGFTKEVIRFNPPDIPQFAVELSNNVIIHVIIYIIFINKIKK